MKMTVKEVTKLSGKAVKTQLCEKSWKNSSLLVMTENEGLHCIWSLTSRLQLKLLLESRDLDARSFFSFVEVGGQALDSESQPARQVALLCSTGSLRSTVRILRLHKQKTEEDKQPTDS